MEQSSDATTGMTPEAEEPLLDQRVDLARISSQTIAWAALFAIAALIRLIRLTAFPLSAAEATAATDALALVQGAGLSADAAAHPLLAALTGAAFFLFGASDGIARLAAVALGLGSVALLRALRTALPPGTAWAAGLMLALSPTFVAASREVGEGALLTFTTLAVLVTVQIWRARPTVGHGMALGVAIGALPLSSPLGWIALLPALVAGLLVSEPSRPRWRDLVPVALGGLATIVIVSTDVFTRPGGFGAFFDASLGSLWSARIAELGDNWLLVPIQLATDELPPLIAAIWGAVVALRGVGQAERRAPRVLLGWAVLAAVLATALGAKDVPLLSFGVLPLTLLAGVGLRDATARVAWSSLGTLQGASLVAALVLAIAAGASLLGMFGGAVGPDTLSWLIRFAVVGLLIFAPLVALAIWLGRRMRQSLAPLLGCLLLLALVGLSLRASLLLGATAAERPGELLRAGNAAPASRLMVERLERLSRDETTFQAGAADPTGGHGLSITLDAAVAQPFAWYLRDFPNVRIVSAGTPAIATQVIIASPDRADALIPPGAGYVTRDYAYQLVLPPVYADASLGNLLRSIARPSDLRRFGGFLIDRQTTRPGEPDQVVLALDGRLGEKLFGPTTGS